MADRRYALLGHVHAAGSGSVGWGAITGTLADQTDLQAALDLKAPLASPTFTGVIDVSSATFSGLDSNDLVDVASIAMLDEAETVTGLWTFNEEIQLLPQTAPTHAEGLLWYDSTEKSLSYYNDEADVTINVGQENVIRVRNTTGATITNGSAVYISGATGANLPNIALAQANTLATAECIGLVTHDIENNSNGYVTTLGIVRDLDTSAWSAGAELFLSPSVAGGLTSTKPTSDFCVPVGYVVVSNVSIGEIKVTMHPEANRGDLTSKSQNETVTGSWDFAAQTDITLGNILRIWDATNTDYAYFSHDGTYFNLVTVNTNAFRIGEATWITGGNQFRIYDSGGTDYGGLSHNGTDFATTFINTSSWRTSGALNFVFGNSTQDSNIVCQVTGDYFPYIKWQRTGGTTKTNQVWGAVVGSTGNLQLSDETNSVTPLTLNPSAPSNSLVIGVSNVAVGNTLSVTGNIAVTGTVDGRDVATDGTKLDGIETGATADMSAAEIEAIVNHDNLLGFVANEHIDWTAASAAFSTTGTLAAGTTTITGNLTTSGYLEAVRSGGLAKDMLHLRDSTDTQDWVIYYDGGWWEVRSEQSGTGTRWMKFDTGQLVSFDGNVDIGAGLDVTGNITVTGTVDGRDVAADGTKLDGIESGATADQSAAEIEAIVNHDNLLGFVANEHIDWTAASAAFSTTGGATITNGLGFGSVVAASATDLSEHIALYGSLYGFSITASNFNLVAAGVNTFSSTQTELVSRVNHDFSAGIDVTGNITVTGTVDGVDIAAGATNWNTAYGWGDHAGLYEPVDASLVRSGTLSQEDNYTYLNRTNAANPVLHVAQVGAGPVAQFGKAPSLGSTGYTQSVTIGGDGSVTATGAVTGSNLNVSNWDTAYGWGNHASAGYLLASSSPTISGSWTFSNDLVVTGGSIYLTEGAAPSGDTAGRGQFWVKNDSPNTPWFTDDASGDQLLDPSQSEIVSKTASYTLVLSDKGKTIRFTGSTASQTFTIPANASVAFPVGTIIAFQNNGTVAVNIAITTDTMTDTSGTTGTQTLNANKVAIVQKVASTDWIYMAASSSGILNVVEDTTPSLGGNLDLNSFTINGTGTINFTGAITASSTITGSSFSGSGASLTSLTAANISSGNLGSGVLPYSTASATASAFAVPFLNTTGVASGNFGTLLDSGGGFTYNPSTNTLVAGAFSGSGASLTSLTAANISAGSLVNGVNQYFTASSTAAHHKIPFMNYTGTSSTNASMLHDTESTFTYNPSTNEFSAPIVRMAERGTTAPTASASYGYLWVQTQTPNYLMFTDDASTTKYVGMGQYTLIANQSFNMNTAGNAEKCPNGAWYSDNATAYTLTLENSTGTDFPVGSQMTIWNEGSGTLTITEGTSTTLYLLTGSAVTDTAGGCTMAQGGYATLIRKSATVYLIMGAGLTA